MATIMRQLLLFFNLLSPYKKQPNLNPFPPKVPAHKYDIFLKFYAFAINKVQSQLLANSKQYIRMDKHRDIMAQWKAGFSDKKMTA